MSFRSDVWQLAVVDALLARSSTIGLIGVSEGPADGEIIRLSGATAVPSFEAAQDDPVLLARLAGEIAKSMAFDLDSRVTAAWDQAGRVETAGELSDSAIARCMSYLSQPDPTKVLLIHPMLEVRLRAFEKLVAGQDERPGYIGSFYGIKGFASDDVYMDGMAIHNLMFTAAAVTLHYENRPAVRTGVVEGDGGTVVADWPVTLAINSEFLVDLRIESAGSLEE